MRSIHRRGLVAVAATACACAALLSGTPVARGATTAELNGQVALLKEMNQARASRGIAPLRLSKILSRPARQHSAYLAQMGELDHDGADGRPFYVRLYNAGFPRTRAVGENLGLSGGCATDLAETMVEMWLDSPGHRRNLLSRDFKVVGLAIVAADDCNSTVYTTDFGG
jgi:uncharacterized protein YkwD